MFEEKVTLNLMGNCLEKSQYYANMPMQYAAIFTGCKNDTFKMKNLIFFFFLLKTSIVGTR